MASPEAFHRLAREMTGGSRTFGSDLGNARSFRATFGLHSDLCFHLWLIGNWTPGGTKPNHLLWTLMFMKVYGTELVLCTIAGADPKTYRKWVWRVLNSIANCYNDVVSGSRWFHMLY
jgi:hypothetical protein